MIINRSNDCPHCGVGHTNSCYIVFDTGYKCFSCGKSNFKSSDYFCYRDEPMINNNNLFPPEHTLDPREFSINSLAWLYSYYLDNEMIRRAGIGYAPAQASKTESLVFFAYNETGKPLGYQRRFFPKQFFSTANLKSNIVLYGGMSNTIVLVEDYISAIRVGQHCPTICLFGTGISDNYINYVINNYDNVLIWLDDDEPGITAANKIERSLIKAYNNAILNRPLIFNKTIKIKKITKSQPKELSKTVIKETLNSYIGVI